MDERSRGPQTTPNRAQEPSSLPALPLADNQFYLRDMPQSGGLLVAEAVAVFAVDGRLCATQAKCPHLGGPLSEGSLAGKVLTCPWHGAQFDVCTGELLRGPATRALDVYTVRIQGDIGELVVE
jgi:nitrite reductase/ring-hydroxylating ferredoxin subunit